MTKVLLAVSSHDVLGDTGNPTGYSVSEAAHPYHVFMAAGCAVEFVSVTGGEPPAVVFEGEENDPEIVAFLADEVARAKLAATRPASTIRSADFQAIFYVGGHGAMWDFPHSPDLARIATEIYQDGGVIAAVCHGPAGLVGLRLPDGSPLVRGKRVASFTNEEEASLGLVDVMPFLLEDRLKELGALHTKASNYACHTEQDGRLITGQNPASAASLARLVVEQLATSATTSATTSAVEAEASAVSQRG